MSDVPVILLKSLTVDYEVAGIVCIGDCIMLDTAGFREVLRVNGVTGNKDDHEKFDLLCTPLEPPV